jgi:predicted transposase/invertase (TIGR01784 family)
MKRLLRSKANFGILEGFLSELLGRDIKILEVIDSESNKEDERAKFNRVDILAKLSDGEIVLIEVQSNTESDYFCRMIFGTSKIITEHLKEGDPYINIKKVYSVNILYFDLGHGTDYIYHGTTSFTGIHTKDQLSLTEKQKSVYKKDLVHQIYPEYYLIKVNQFNDIAKNTLDEWIYFLKNETIQDGFHAKGILEAKEKLDSLKLSDTEKQEYKRYVEDLSFQKSMLVSNYRDGEIDGMRKGEIKGKIEGIAEGIEKGEKAKAIDVAKKLKSLGVATEIIKQSTGLSESELEKV